MPRAKKQHLKKRPDGRYLCRYKGKCFYGYTEEEALAAREDYKRELATGVPSGIPYFGEYAVIWLKSYKAHLETETYNSYARALNKFLAFLPDRPITEIKASDIAAFYQSLSKQSASTIGIARAAIKGVFGAAYNDMIINRNPALMVIPPKGTKGTETLQKKRQKAKPSGVVDFRGLWLFLAFNLPRIFCSFVPFCAVNSSQCESEKKHSFGRFCITAPLSSYSYNCTSSLLI